MYYLYYICNNVVLESKNRLNNMTSVRLPQVLEARLNRLSSETHRTKSFYITKAIEQCIEDFGDLYIAMQRMNNPNAKFYTTAEVRKYLGIEGGL